MHGTRFVRMLVTLLHAGYTEMHIEGASEEERMAQAALAKSERMQQVLSALAVLASSSGVASERQQFMELVKDEIGRLLFCHHIVHDHVAAWLKT